MRKQIIILILLGLTNVSNAHSRVSLTSNDIVLRGLAAPSDASQIAMINDFSESLKSVCKDGKLPSCSFPQLFKIYKLDLGSIKSIEQSGLEIAKIPGLEASFAPQSLQSGAWISVPFSLADGTQTVTRMILTKIALEKALLAHKAYLLKMNPQYLNDVATFALPQMIASFSGYSTSLKALKYAEYFTCKTAPSFKSNSYCDQNFNLIYSITAEIKAALDSASIDRLSQLDTSNSTDKVLKTKMVLDAAKAIQRIRQELNPDQILASIQGKATYHQIQNLENILTDMSVSPVATSQLEYHRMLTAIAILSEIQVIQESSRAQLDHFRYSETPLKNTITNEMTLLKNWIAMYLVQQEEIPQ